MPLILCSDGINEKRCMRYRKPSTPGKGLLLILSDVRFFKFFKQLRDSALLISFAVMFNVLSFSKSSIPSVACSKSWTLMLSTFKLTSFGILQSLLFPETTIVRVSI